MKANSLSEINQINTMADALKRLVGFSEPNIVIDIGAAKGDWTKTAMQVWPHAEYYLIEPIPEQIEKMPSTLKESSNVSVIQAVGGPESGEEILTITDDLDGSGIYGNAGENTRSVPVISIDNLIRNKDGKVLMKLDTHGFEIPIFKGAEETLNNTEAIIVEVYGFSVSPTGKLFHEISDYLIQKGFRLFDIVDIMRRPKDKAFWQADAVYLRSDHPIFIDNSYQ